MADEHKTALKKIMASFEISTGNHAQPFKSPRDREIRNIHIAKTFFKWNDTKYRDELERITGLRSSTDMGAKQRQRLAIDEFYKLGWRPKTHRKPGQVPASKAARSPRLKRCSPTPAALGLCRRGRRKGLQGL